MADNKKDIKETEIIEKDVVEMTDDMIENLIGEKETYVTNPILLDEKVIMENEDFHEGLRKGLEVAGMFTAMVNAGMSIEFSENYILNMNILDKTMEEKHNKSYDKIIKEESENF